MRQLQTLTGEIACLGIEKHMTVDLLVVVFKEVERRHDVLRFLFDGLPLEVGSGVCVDL